MTTPSRGSRSITRVFTAAAALAFAGGGSAAPSAPGAPIVLPAPASVVAAAAAIESATGAKAEPLETAAGTVPPGEGRSFAMDGRTAARLLAGSHAAWRGAGLYLFRIERSYGMAGDKDRVAVLAAADRAAVIRRVGTSGEDVTPDRIVAFLAELEKEEPFELLEVGLDYVAGQFRRVPADPAALAERLAGFAPELAAGKREKMLALLAEELRKNRTLYLFW